MSGSAKRFEHHNATKESEDGIVGPLFSVVPPRHQRFKVAHGGADDGDGDWNECDRSERESPVCDHETRHREQWDNNSRASFGNVVGEGSFESIDVFDHRLFQVASTVVVEERERNGREALGHQAPDVSHESKRD